MKLCCPKEILPSLHNSKPHFVAVTEERCQAPSFLSGLGKHIPSDLLDLSNVLHLSGYYSSQVNKAINKDALICLLVHVCYIEESLSHKDSLFISLLINQQKMFGRE